MLWRHYFNGSDAVIFVIDSNDKDRIGVARDEVHRLLVTEELRNARILVYANSMSASDVAAKLGLHKLHHHW